MISEILGLSINQKVLNKKSSSRVVSTLQKTATNYLAIGRMAEDLKLIRLNFSRWLAMEGVKVKGTPDAHMLKEDELAKKFGVMREKYVSSKSPKATRDGASGNSGLSKLLMARYLTKKFTVKLERKLAASILKRYKKMTAVRKLVRIKRKFLSLVKGLLNKLNIKKLFGEWFKKNVSKIIKPLVDVFSNSLKRFMKKGLTKLIQRGAVAVTSSLWAGPFLPIVAGIALIGLIIWEPIKDAWEAFTKGEDFVDAFIVGILDEFTFGLFGKENIKDFKKTFSEWYDDLFKKLFKGIDESIKFVEEKFTVFADFIINKGKELFTTETTPADFKSSFEEYNMKRMEQDAKEREKYAEYFNQMTERIEKKKIRIRQLEIEIATLEYDIEYLTAGPEKARLKEAQIEKAKEEKEKTVLESELKKTKEGGTAQPEEKPKPKVAPQPKKEEVKPSPKPVEVVPASKPTQTTGQYENIKQMVIANEGWRNKPYKDSRGLWTVGVGHLIGNGKTLPKEWNREFSNQEVRELFEKDFAEHLKLAEKAPGWNLANEAGKAGLIDLTYNMGGYWYTKFKTAAGLLKDGKFKEAADEFKASKWYKQVGDRAPATVSLIRSGSATDKSGSAALAAILSSNKVAGAGKFINQESTQVAQAQREQLKPKDVDVVKVAQTNNNKKVQQENLAMKKKETEVASIVADRAAA